jgi:hypothetical protein
MLVDAESNIPKPEEDFKKAENERTRNRSDFGRFVFRDPEAIPESADVSSIEHPANISVKYSKCLDISP